MALPKPASEWSRQLLQLIWDLCWDQRRKQAAWPTLAALLAAVRSREVTHPDGLQVPGAVLTGGEVDALLAQMPTGFINGVGPSASDQLSTEKQLSLTIAGIAACSDTEETLALFLAFIQRMIAYESMFWGNGSSSRSQDKPAMTFKSFLADIAWSDEKSFRGYSSRPRRREELVSRLHLILASEPIPWVNLSECYKGNWLVQFDRRIRYFKDVRNLDDYWESRFKPWVSADPVPYPVVAASPTPDQVSRPGILRGNPDILADYLLLRTFDCCDQPLRRVSCPRIDPDVGSALIHDAVHRLEARGLIRSSVAITAGMSTPRATLAVLKVMLTNEGIRRASELRSGWADGILRDRAARDAVLSWFYDQRIHPNKVVHANWIFGDPRSFYSGQFFSKDDIFDAVRYLRAKNLIEGSVSALEGDFSAFPRITASGIDCIEEGDGVAEYVKQPARASVTYTFNAPVSGTNVAIGDSATQQAAVYGMETDNLRVLIDAIVQALPSLGFNAQLFGETKGAVDVVAVEAGQSHPDRNRLHAALGKTRDLLAEPATRHSQLS